MAINWIETEIIEHKRWTDVLASLKFKGNVLPYTAGQFTKVGLEIDGGDDLPPIFLCELTKRGLFRNYLCYGA